MERVEFDGLSSTGGNFETSEDPVSMAWSAIGQYTDLINPCAFMTFMGAIANDGRAAVPYIVAAADDGKDGYTAQTAYAEGVISRDTAALVRQYMRHNVTTKYGNENFPGLTVCAKTGTAEKDNGEVSNAMFAGFVTDDAYPLAFIICVEEGGYGASTCIPIASEVLTACKELMDS